jgi:hypothetical protein
MVETSAEEISGSLINRGVGTVIAKKLDLLAGPGVSKDQRYVVGLETGSTQVGIHRLTGDDDGLLDIKAQQLKEPLRFIEVRDRQRHMVEVRDHSYLRCQTGEDLSLSALCRCRCVSTLGDEGRARVVPGLGSATARARYLGFADRRPYAGNPPGMVV